MSKSKSAGKSSCAYPSRSCCAWTLTCVVLLVLYLHLHTKSGEGRAVEHASDDVVRVPTSTTFVNFKPISSLKMTKHHTHLRSQRFGGKRFRSPQNVRLAGSSLLSVKAGPSDASGPTVFLVRTYKPTSAMRDRIVAWFTSVHALPNVEFWISTNGEKADMDPLAKALKGAGFEATAWHTYTEANMREAYPALASRGDLAYIYHSPAVDLWWQEHARDSECTGTARPRNVWIFEDDVGYSGDISEIVQEYYDDPADLITLDCNGGKDVDTANWHNNAVTEQWLQRVPSLGDRQAYCEFVQRHSAALLDEMHTWSVRGQMNLSESMPGTICKLEGLSVRFIDAKHHSDDPALLKWNGRVSKQVFDKELADNTRKFFHALKY